MRTFLRMLFVAGVFALSLAVYGEEARAEAMVSSWYGPGLEGNVTASGEVFDPYNDYTAAHRYLPMGTELKVCYETCAVVRVNDRGPYGGGKDLDLSQAAAEEIGLSFVGTDVVEVRVLGDNGPSGGSKSGGRGAADAAQRKPRSLLRLAGHGYNHFVGASAEKGLQGVRFFEFLTEEEREEFLEASELVTFEPGETIIGEGGQTHDLFVLTSGRVEVRKSVPGGRDRLLAEIAATSERTVVGERGLLGESGASATVGAASRVEAIKIPHQTFRRMVSEGRPAAFKLSYRIARTLARRLTRLDEEVVEAIRDLESRGETDLEAFRDKLITDWAV